MYVIIYHHLYYETHMIVPFTVPDYCFDTEETTRLHQCDWSNPGILLRNPPGM